MQLPGQQMKTSVKESTQKVRICNVEKIDLNMYEKQTPWESQVMWFQMTIHTDCKCRNPHCKYTNPYETLLVFDTDWKNPWQAPEKHNLDNNMPFGASFSTSYRVLTPLEGTIPGTWK